MEDRTSTFHSLVIYRNVIIKSCCSAKLFEIKLEFFIYFILGAVAIDLVNRVNI